MYLVAGDHADTLASGQPIAPGDELANDAVNPDHPNDQRLLAEGALIKLAGKPPRAGQTQENS